ncbi:hypothetical protein FO519_000242 [Halicephalobus sp. NKZ332]|nr:hypothetical protein FO519_000242 [Halicephalobus sp. NKZ332]
MYEEERLPENLEWYEDQVAGHHPSIVRNGIKQIGIIKERGRENRLLKVVQDGKRGESEVTFYEAIFRLNKTEYNKAQRLALTRLRGLVPRYFGKRVINIANRDYEFMEMEDITYPFKKPCIMDIKIGQVTYDPDASERKKVIENAKFLFQKEIGFRILGYKLCPDDYGNIQVRSRRWGYALTPSDIEAAFEEYLQATPTESKKKIVEGFLRNLSSISAWFEFQEAVQFYSSSLLFVYEGDPSSETPPIVKMIDFSHVFYEEKKDSNYIHGLNYITNQFKNIGSKS